MTPLSEVNRQFLAAHVERLSARRKTLEVRIHYDDDKWEVADRIDRTYSIQAIAMQLLGMPVDMSDRPGTQLLNEILAADS